MYISGQNSRRVPMIIIDKITHFLANIIDRNKAA